MLSCTEPPLPYAVADEEMRRRYLTIRGLPLGSGGLALTSEGLYKPTKREERVKLNEQEDLDAWTCPRCDQAMTAEVRGQASAACLKIFIVFPISTKQPVFNFN